MECRLPAQLQATLEDGDEPTGFTAPARIFTEMLAALPEANVLLDRPDGGNKIHVRCARSDYNLLGLAAEEFPAAPDVSHRRPSSRSAASCSRISFGMSRLPFRPTKLARRLTGVLITFDGTTLKAVATDTHRLAVRTVTLEGGTGSRDRDRPGSRHERAACASLRMRITVSISLAQGQARFRGRHDDHDVRGFWKASSRTTSE